MTYTKDRHDTPRKAATATPKPDTQAGAPRSASTALGSNVRAELSSEETRRRIAEAAYYKAKQRGFEPGHELDDWIKAESEVMGRVNGASR